MKSVLLLLLAVLLAAVALGAEAPAPAVLPPCCRAPLQLGQPTTKSLLLLDSKWTSDVGKVIPLSVFRGRPLVVAMFFTQCEYACPVLVNDLKQIEAKLPAEVREKTDFLLVSFDTRRDTPAQLAEYRKKKELAPAHWALLHGEEDDVRELAALLGINYAADAKGQFAHSNVLTVLNAEGEIVLQLPGLRQNAAPILEALQKASLAAKR